MLPPREGFGPQAVGAIGLLVNRLAAPGDVIVGQAGRVPAFAGRRFVPAATPFWPPFGRTERYMAGVVGTLRRLRPGLVEVHNRANLAARVARALPGARVVLFVHNDPQAMRGARTAAERAGLLRQMTVVCVSRAMQARFMEGVDAAYGASGDACGGITVEDASGGTDGEDASGSMAVEAVRCGAPVVLPNAIELADLPPARAAGEREATVLFVGRVVADKGADAFVRACAAVLPGLPGWRAEMIGADRFWAGSAETPFQRKLAASAKAAGIVCRGYVPHAEVLEAMAAAAIVVVPSRWEEPFGLTALEAIASGAALVCSARGGLPEVAGEAALYAGPDEPGALEAAIARLAGDAGLRARLAAAGLARAAQFDAPAARARLVELRCRLLDTL